MRYRYPQEAAHWRHIFRAWTAFGVALVLNVVLEFVHRAYGDLTPVGALAHFLALSCLGAAVIGGGRARYWRGRLDQLRVSAVCASLDTRPVDHQG